MDHEIYDKLNDEEQFMVKPLAGSGSTGIMLSTLWSQSGVAQVGNNTTVRYNEYCPYISGSSTHSVTGCTNTAAGQIIYYFIDKGLLDFQLTLDAADAYTDDNGLQIKADGSTPGTVSFSVINSKLSQYDLKSADDAAALVYACGVVQEATYGNSTSTAWSLDLFYRSGFECANRAYLWAGNSVFWGAEGAISEGGFEVLIENLTAGRVVGTSYPGHALVIDGYDSSTDKFHINYGWGNSTSTRWYTRAEMNAIGYHDFIYDLMPEGEKDLFVTDSRIYGTGTLARALELANGTKGANTVTVDKSLAGEKLAGNMNFRFKEETTVRNFNMELMTFSSSSYGYGFVSENDAVGIFTDFTGALITVGGNYGYAFSFSSSDRLELSTDQAVIYAGNYRVNGDAGAGAEAVLASLRASQKNNSAVEAFVLDSSASSYSFYGSTGNDTITLDNKTIVAGNIYLYDGNDILTVSGNSHVYGNLNCGGGSDVITIDSSSSVTGCFYGTGDLNFILTSTPDNEAIFFIEDNVYNLNVNAAISVDLSDAGAGRYTLIEAVGNASYLSSLDSISITVKEKGATVSTLSINGTSDCTHAKLLREANALVLQVKVDNRDLQPPTVPSGLKASPYGDGLRLDWQNSTDNEQIEGYYVRYGTTSSLTGNGTFFKESEAFFDTLENGIWYFQVRAKDNSGNLSDWSGLTTFTIIAKPVTISSEGILVSSAVSMTGKTLSNAVMAVSNGGTAVRTTLSEGGVQNVFSGGLASDTKVSSGGIVKVSAYGSLGTATVFNGGSAVVFSNGSASDMLVSNGGIMTVSKGGYTSNVEIKQGGRLTVTSAGSATDVTASDGGIMTVSRGGYASNVEIKQGGSLELNSTGSAANVTIAKGGTICGLTLQDEVSTFETLTLSSLNIKSAVVQSGNKSYIHGVVSNTEIASGGFLTVYKGGNASGTVVSGGRFFISSGGTGTDTLIAGGTNFIYTGGRTSGTILTGGQLRISSGGLAADTTVSGGSLCLFSNGTASGMLICSGGSALLNEGGVLTGTVVTEGYIYADSGVNCADAKIILKLDKRTTADSYIVRNMNYLSDADISITVADNQVLGTYQLASNAADYTGTITIGSGTQTFGSLSAGAAALEHGCYSYSLETSGNYLNLVVAASRLPAPAVTANTTDPTNKDVILTPVFDALSAVNEFRINGGNWQNCTGTVTISQNCVVEFRCKDAFDVYSDITVFNVTNIDVVSPVITVTESTSSPAKQVILTVSVDDGSTIIYSTDNRNWSQYTAPITVTANGNVFFSASDAAGNTARQTVNITNIDQTAPDVPDRFSFSIVQGTLRVDWNDVTDNGIAGVTGYKLRYGREKLLSGNGETVANSQIDIPDIAGGIWYFQVQSVDAAGNASAWSEIASFTVSTNLSDLQGSSAGVSWNDTLPSESYSVVYSKDNFAHLLSLKSGSCGVDTFGMPAASYRWRVNSIEGPAFDAGGEIPAGVFKSDADGIQDLFFGAVIDTWDSSYAAEHQISGELVMLQGKNRIAGIYEGSADASILVLTDDSNGDALFVDDIYTAFGNRARFAQIDEIRAGAGDDIVDMTSNRYDYTGNTIRIFGGDGNDVLWGAAESNILSGDAGDDRLTGSAGSDILIGGSGSDSLQGGGGNDIFIFGADWGSDTVEQLNTGTVTLWFESGSTANWDAVSYTYSEGENTVSVKGCTAVTLKFGDDDSLPENCFSSALTDKIFS